MTVIASATKPSALPPRFEVFPEALTVHERWASWRWELRKEKRSAKQRWTKPPRNARTDEAASSTNAATWSPFAAAVAAYDRGGWDGVGFMLGAPFSGADLDNVRDPATGTIHPVALEVVTALASYTEITPSGRGLRVFTTGRLPDGWRSTKKWTIEIELYDEARFLTVTGWHLDDTPTTVEDRPDALAALHERVARETDRAVPPSGGSHVPSSSSCRRPIEDTDLLAAIRASQQGATFSRLFDHGCADGEDHSALDLHLCSLLAFWCARDPDQIDRLFRQSALFRSKWTERHYRDGRTYGQATITKAIAGCRETYMSGRRRHASARPHPSTRLEPSPIRLVSEYEPTPSAPPQPYTFDHAFPAEHFVSQMIAYASACTDAAYDYHELAALILLANVTPNVRAWLSSPSPGRWPASWRPSPVRTPSRLPRRTARYAAISWSKCCPSTARRGASSTSAIATWRARTSRRTPAPY